MSEKSMLKVESKTIYVRRMTLHNRYKRKSCKKDISKELMPVAWHPTKWWDWCMPEDDKNEIKPFFIDKSYCKVVGIVMDKRLKKCAIKLLVLLFLQYNLFLNTIKLKK